MKRSILPAAVVAIALAPACQVTDFQATPARTWEAIGGSVAGTDLDEAGELRGSTLGQLGIGGREANDRLSVEWNEGEDHWELFGHSTDSSARGTLADDFHLNGVQLVYDEGEVDTDLHLGLYGLRWVRPVAESGALKVSAGAALVVAEFDLELEQEVLDLGTGETTEKSTGKDALMPFPLPALDLRYDHASFDARLVLSGLWVSVDEGSGHIIDLDFQFVTPLFDDVGQLVVGYHELEMELNHSSVDERARLDVSYSGPYLGLRFSF